MNSSAIKNIIRKNGLFTTNMTRSALLVSLFLSVFSASTFADRPAMNDAAMNSPDDNNTSATMMDENTNSAEQNAELHRPQAEAPSAVEIMMQQQPQYSQQSGDNLHLPAKEMQPGETLTIQLLDAPRRGMSMDRVQQAFGQPMTSSDSVGQPPITHWVYNDRIVYFEYATVLHVVAR